MRKYLPLVILFLVIGAGIAVAQTVHWRIKLNTGQVGQIIGGPLDTDPAILTAVQSTGNIGIGTTNPTAKLNINGSDYAALRADDATVTGSNKGYETYIYSDTTGGAQGTYIGNNSSRPLYLMTGYTGRLKITSGNGNYIGTDDDWKIGIGASPEAGNARLVVCRKGSGAGGMCNVPPIVPTVALFGSVNNLPTGSSIRTYGRIEAGGIVRAAGWETGAIDLGEYVLVEGRASNYEQGDVLVISSQKNTFKKSGQKYDSKVAGIVTTTAGYIGGVPEEGAPAPLNKVVMALVGQLPAKASAENGPIAIGDLLTTSSTSGYLMKCPTDTSEQKLQCFGAIVAKALEPLESENGKIMVLLTLQ